MNCNYYRIFCFPTRIHCGDNQSLRNKLKTCGYFLNIQSRQTYDNQWLVLLQFYRWFNRFPIKYPHTLPRILFFFYFPFQRNIVIQDGYKKRTTYIFSLWLCIQLQHFWCYFSVTITDIIHKKMYEILIFMLNFAVRFYGLKICLEWMRNGLCS